MRVSSAADILQVMKEQLLGQLSRPKYELLVRPLTAIDYSPPGDDEGNSGSHGAGGSGAAGRLSLGISNEVLRGWLIDQYGELLAELAELVCGTPVLVEVAVRPTGAVPDDSPGAADAAPQLSVMDAAAERAPEPRRPLLNPRYTFEHFVSGKSSQFALSACQQVAHQPALSYNPLYLYGGVGLGKTHLMHAIGHALWQRDHRARVLYVTSEKFLNEFVEGVRGNRMGDFHERYRGCDLLLLDDVQFFAGKGETQQEFFHTLSSLTEAGGQLVVSGDRPPRALRVDDRLASRLAMGLVCDLGEPQMATRVAILHAKARLERMEVPEEVCQFIAERVSGNVRELEGALIRLIAFCEFGGGKPDLEVAARVLADFVDPGGIRPQLSIKQVMGVTGEYFNVSEQLLLSPNRSKRVALARMVVMYLAREYTNLTLSQIGAELGGRDHSTISHGVNKIARELLEDPYVEQAVTQISRMLK
jgi:chromosomal replication initiator protein